MNRWGLRSASLTAAAVLLPAPAYAHLVNSGLGPFYDGIGHFALTPEARPGLYPWPISISLTALQP